VRVREAAQCERSEGGVLVRNLVTRFVHEDEGQDVIEYALLAAFLVVVVATIVSTVGQDLVTIYSNVKAQTAAAS
jgi:Flp pilus assembly pilin Flp